MLKQRGYSLIEMMVSAAIAMILMLGITVFFMSSSRATLDNVKSTRVNNVLRATMELMSREITRAGYWHDSYQHIGPGYNNPFTTLLVGQFHDAGDCVVFAYDANGNGELDASEFRGFRRNGNAIEMKTSGAA